jgi:hypothetical protein
MTSKVPSADLSLDPDQHPEEPKPFEQRRTRTKATFQWPPDCLWPFMDGGWDSET